MRSSYLIIEASGFTGVVSRYFGSDDSYAAFQSELVVNPDAGAVVTGAALIRKVRWGDSRRGSGKRGGLRIIYIHIPDLKVLFMLDVYGKDEADDLTSAEKKELRDLAKIFIYELHERNRKGRL